MLFAPESHFEVDITILSFKCFKKSAEPDEISSLLIKKNHSLIIEHLLLVLLFDNSLASMFCIIWVDRKRQY